jgi:multidrug resistance efflux pump
MKLNKIGLSVFSLVGLVAASTVAVPAFAQYQSWRNYGYRNAAAPSCPEIHRALDNLQQAQQNLSNAQHDYQGHRAAALKSTNTAISEVQQALQSRDCR